MLHKHVLVSIQNIVVCSHQIYITLKHCSVHSNGAFIQKLKELRVAFGLFRSGIRKNQLK